MGTIGNKYKSTSVLSPTSFSDWLHYSLSILLQTVGSVAVCGCQQNGGRFFTFSNDSEKDLDNLLVN